MHSKFSNEARECDNMYGITEAQISRQQYYY